MTVGPRTNNPAEQAFALARCKLRGRLGHAHLGQGQQHQLVEAALAANLLELRFVRIVCGALNELPTNRRARARSTCCRGEPCTGYLAGSMAQKYETGGPRRLHRRG